MAIKMVREPSATPNINNIDDIVPMRYAYGNQNGYVKSKGTEIAATVNGSNFTIGSGRIVLQGVECDIDANGVTITVDNIATKKYFSVYLSVNLATNSVSIKTEDDIVAYPEISPGDDLTHTSTGIANLEIYRFTATAGTISEVQKIIKEIQYLNIIESNDGLLLKGEKIISQKIKLWEAPTSSGKIISGSLNARDTKSEICDLKPFKEQIEKYPILEIVTDYGVFRGKFGRIKFLKDGSMTYSGSSYPSIEIEIFDTHIRTFDGEYILVGNPQKYNYYFTNKIPTSVEIDGPIWEAYSSMTVYAVYQIIE